MQIAQLTGVKQFRLVDGNVADPGPGEIQVDVQAVGICGSDVHYYAEGAVGDVSCVYPMVLGHEPAGTVRKVGPGVTGWSKGDRAALEPAMYCYHCEFCRAGHHNVCENIRFFSSPSDPGFFRQVANLPAKNLVALPPDMDINLATLFEPLAVILHSLEFAQPALGDTALVIGAGPIGLQTIAALQLAGIRQIFCTEPVPQRRDLAKHVGATEIMDPRETDPAREILAATHNRGVDFTVDCAAKPGTLDLAFNATRNRGRIILTGIHSERHVPVDLHIMRKKEQVLFNVRRSNKEEPLAIKLLTEYPQLFAPMLTHRKPLAEVGPAFHMLDTYADGACKVIIAPQQS